MEYEVGKWYDLISEQGAIRGKCTSITTPDADGSYSATFEQFPDRFKGLAIISETLGEDPDA